MSLSQCNGEIFAAVFNRLSRVPIIYRHLHRLPMGGVAVVHPILLDQDPSAGARAVGDNGGVVAGLAVDGGLVGGVSALFQDQVLIPAALFVVFREAV